MRIIDIQRVPNQELSFTQDDNRWLVRIKKATTSMVADVSINDEVVVSGLRIPGDGFILPYRHLGVMQGNLMLTVERELAPDYNQFGITQFLYYWSPEEMESLAGGN